MAEDGTRYDLEALRRLVAEDPGCPEFPALAEAERRAGRPQEARRISEAGLARSPGRLAGRVSLGLALLDLGVADGAGRELSRILDPVLEPHRLATPAPASAERAGSAPHAQPAAESGVQPEPLAVAPPSPADGAAFAGGVADDELEEAFAAAEPQTDQMVSANDMAEQVLLQYEPLDGEEAEDLEMGADTPLGGPFSTETMASLLERQGDHDGATAIRRELGRGATRPPAALAEAEPGVAPDALSATDSGETTGQGGEPWRTRVVATLEGWLHNIQRGTA